MLDGWYCRSMANANSNDEESVEDEESQDEEVINYKEQYKQLKRKLKYLIYENENFQEALRSAQRRLIIATHDRSFLLDRLLLYERVENSSSESEETDSSDDPDLSRIDVKRKKLDSNNSVYSMNNNQTSIGKTSASVKKKKPTAPKIVKQNVPQPVQTQDVTVASTTSDGHMTPEEVERHLQSRQTFMELLPERAPPTVPNEMFSNDPSLDSESNDIGEMETSPSNIGEDLSVDMMAE